jgi:exodeoxyribonuclease III
MRIATWNVNSLRARLERVQEWTTAHEPDVLCLQETKLADKDFPTDAFTELGYETVHHGNGRWNGVAIASRVGLDGPRAGFIDDVDGSIEECRIVAATCGSVRVFSVYVPNGRTVDSEHYAFKLNWLSQLRHELDATCATTDAVAVLGDFNVAPTDRDVWDITQFEGMTHVTPAERASLGDVIDFGLVDAVRTMHPDEDGPFSWWDYRGGAFHRGFGMRIDLALVTPVLADRLVEAGTDREARRGQGTERQPSDHAPVVIDLSD